MLATLPAKYLLNQSTRRALSTTTPLPTDFTHVIIGAGAVGLSIATHLASYPSTRTLLLERHSTAGTETSSRNSEVIHAGLYYGPSSLKTRLCLRGKSLLYDFCARHAIPHRRTGKWIVAQDEAQFGALERIHAFAREVGVPTRFLTESEVVAREGGLVRARAGVLESGSTGIVDSHALMGSLEGRLQERGGVVAFRTAVRGVRSLVGGGFEVEVEGEGEEEGQGQRITTETLVNSAGLAAVAVGNMLLPPERQVKAFFAKGTYFSYSAPWPKPSTLVYPAPKEGLGGLGTHLTLDLAEPPRVRFGPDVEWVDDPGDLTPNRERVEEALDEIQEYLPGVRRECVEVDYCGIRPKLGKSGAVAGGKGFQDFVIREEEGFPGFVNLLGIESPGLTSCLAIGEYVGEILYGKGGGAREIGEVV